MKAYLLSIDLGTTSMKTVLYDKDFVPITNATSYYETKYPEIGWAEQDSDDWWHALILTTKEVLEKSQINPELIAGVGIDSMSSMSLPVDKEGKALRKGPLWMDRRATVQCDFFDRHLKTELWNINGNHNDPSNFGPKVLWIKENEPEIYKKTWKFLHANGFLIYKLTNKVSMDISESGLSQLCDITTGQWSDSLLNGLGIDREKLPEVMPCTQVAGTISREASKLTGLREGTPVIAGSMDNVAAGMGTGIAASGEAYISTGTVTTCNFCINSPHKNSAMHLYHHIIPGKWLTVAGVDYGGAGLKWFKDILEKKDYESLNSLAEAVKPDCVTPVFLPYMVGQRAPLWNNNTRGVLFGLHPSTGQGEIAKALMEGNALAARNIFEIVQKNSIQIENIRMTGGCTNSELYVQIFSDVLGKTVFIIGDIDVATRGMAMATAFGIGLYTTFDDVFKKIKIVKQYKPDLNKLKKYDTIFKLFMNLYQKIQDVYSDYTHLNNVTMQPEGGEK